MPDQLQLRGGSTSEHNSFTGVTREVTVDTTKKTLVVHDGSTQGGIPLMKESGANTASSVGIGTGGTNAINIDNNQKVGIGTASPATKLHVRNSGGDAFLRIEGGTNFGVSYRRTSDNSQIGYTGNGGAVNLGAANLGISASNASGNIVFQTAGTAATNERMRITSAGRVGIGETSPAAGLDVKYDVNPVIAVDRGTANNANLNMQYNGTLIGQLTAANGDFQVSAAGASTPISFYTGGSEGARIDSSGRLLVGTTTEGHASADNLTINDSGNGGITIRTGTTSNGAIFFSDATTGAAEYDGYVQYNHGADPFMQFGVGGSTKMAIKGSNLGLGTTSPSTVVHVADADAELTLERTGTHSTSAAPLIQFKGRGPNATVYNFAKIDAVSTGSNNAGHLRFYTNASGTQSERMRIASDGKVGIGATDPSTGQLVVYRATVNSGNPIIQARSNHDATDSVKFEIDGDGDAYFSDRVGIGTTNPGAQLNAANNIVVGNTGEADSGMTFVSSTSGQSLIHFSDATSGNARYDGFFGYEQTGRFFKFGTAQEERMRIDAGGRVLFNMTAPLDTIAGSLNISGGTSGGRIAMQGTTTNAGGGIAEWFAHWDTNKVAGYIARAGGDTTNKDDGELGFFTRESGGSLTERLTIKTDGDIGIGETSPAARLHVASAVDDNLEGLRIINKKNNTNVPDTAFIRLGITNAGGEKVCSINAVQESNTGNSVGLRFSTNSSGSNNGETEKMRLTSAGHLLHGCTQIPDGSNPGTSINNDVNQGQVIVASNSTGSAILLQFRNPNGAVGDIRSGASATTFNTTSDYRLKENAVSISDGITRLKTLKPYKFNFKSDTSTVVDGFFAHEVTAVPEAVTGTKDAVASEDNDLLGVKQGEPIYQTIDHSKLVPLLTAALQEAISKIETLEAKVAALEAA